MNYRRAALILLAIQLVLVLSVAAKYSYERRVCPRVWVEAQQYDPNLAMRGRYMALQLIVDACTLPQDTAHFTRGYVYGGNRVAPGFWTWEVLLGAAHGHLVPRLADHSKNPAGVERLRRGGDEPCNRAAILTATSYFIPDTAKPPFPLREGQALWVEVTVPPSGPPRPIQLAVSSGNGWRPLKLN